MANFLMCDIPEDMKTYLSYYGMNFSKKLYEFAVSNMRRESADGKMEKVKPMTADELRHFNSGIPAIRSNPPEPVFIVNLAYDIQNINKMTSGKEISTHITVKPASDAE